MDLEYAITKYLPPWRWAEVWLALHDYKGRVTPGLVMTVAQRTATNRYRKWAMKMTTGNKWVQRTTTGVMELDWMADKSVVHLFEERDDLQQWEDHLTEDQWDNFRRSL